MSQTSELNIFQRLANVMHDVTYIQKDKKQGMRYSIVSHDVVTAKVRPAMLKHGIVYHPCAINHYQNGNRTEVQLDVKFVNIDNPSEFIIVPSLGYGIDEQDKGPGKAISYAVKYALLKALGLETGDDPDYDQEVELRETVVDELKAKITACSSVQQLEALKISDIAPELPRLTNQSSLSLRAAFEERKLELAKNKEESA